MNYTNLFEPDGFNEFFMNQINMTAMNRLLRRPALGGYGQEFLSSLSIFITPFQQTFNPGLLNNTMFDFEVMPLAYFEVMCTPTQPQ